MKSRLYIVNNKTSDTEMPVDGNASISPDSIDSSVEALSTASLLKQRVIELEEINLELNMSAQAQALKLTNVIETNAKFLSIIAHDLRGPFCSVISVLELLKDSYYDHNLKDVKKYMGMATNSANGTLQLLENLLAWASAQNKEYTFSPAKVNVMELVEEEFVSSTLTAAHKLITLDHNVSSNLFVAADINMIKTVFRNLINNAIKFSFIGGNIAINAHEKKQYVEISIQDNGIGIPQKAMQELFVKNELHTTRGTNNEPGTGLGLAICKEFIEKHGGKIWIESKAEKGSKVIFTLPHYI